MLLSFPAFKDFCRKTINIPGVGSGGEEGEEEEEEEEEEDDLVHPSTLFRFLVGSKGRQEPTAIGGSWSPAEDGANPDFDPKVLIHTAIRCGR